LKFVTILGLLLGLIGVLLLFRYGMPYRVESKGQSFLLLEGTDKTELAEDKRYRTFGNLGLAAVLIGTLLQVVGVFLA
jgi:hypothetical protein